MNPEEPLPPLLHEDRATYGTDMESERLGALLDAISRETIDKRPTLRDRLRALGTPWRMLSAMLGLSVLAFTLVAGAGLRPDLGSPPPLQVGSAVLVLVAAIA